MIINFPSGNPPPEKKADKIVPLSKKGDKNESEKRPMHVEVQKIADLLRSATQPTLKNRHLTQQRSSLPHYIETLARFLRDSIN